MTTQRKPRGPYRKGIQRREQILDAALEVFSQHGDRGSSLQEIADRVGLSLPGLLHYFGSREELLLAVIERRDVLDTESRTVKEETEVRSPGEAVVRTVRHNMEQPGLVKLFVALSAAATEPAHHAHGFFSDRYRDLALTIQKGLESGRENGEIRADANAEHMARLLLAISDGLQIQWLMDPSIDMAAIVETFNLLCQAAPDREPESGR
ncbi:TetR/AcrR family transcriptional regulator [Actinocorallia populi]|uniref:TetR/AcrR family transcriptional regulator n=1 Tax=Actinocorallia populi TaxID=2079200 RepID=UPI000D094CE7|nr:TetR/AcrR family transcriptional regulator [Actinocorallia populi]